MPSSHSALAASVVHATGLLVGFARSLFALALTLTVIVIYDATDFRRQAGMQAEFINRIVRDMVRGKMAKENPLREVLGQTPWKRWLEHYSVLPSPRYSGSGGDQL